MSRPNIFDPFKCTATAFIPDENGELMFAPFGLAGSMYRLETEAQAKKFLNSVGIFCALAATILLGFVILFLLAKIHLIDSIMPWGGWLGAGFAVWFVAFGLWVAFSTRGLNKVSSNAR